MARRVSLLLINCKGAGLPFLEQSSFIWSSLQKSLLMSKLTKLIWSWQFR